MNLFEAVNTDFFKPLCSKHRKKYADIIALFWYMCKDSPTYSSDEKAMIAEAEAYFYGATEDDFDDDEIVYTDTIDRLPHSLALKFINRLKETGWLDIRSGGFGEELQLSFNRISAAFAKTFNDITDPKFTTYKGKLFKISTLLNKMYDIEIHDSPYETILREVYDDINDLNNSLRSLGASIASYIDGITKNKTPQEVIDLFNEYEERVVVASYHRFKTSDNLFNYKSSILDCLEYCQLYCLYMLADDCANVEKISYEDAFTKVTQMLNQIEISVDNMTDIMKEIDNQHIMYRKRAVQRAQFLLFTDGTMKGKLNNLLKYYSLTISEEQELMDDDQTIVGECIELTSQWGMGVNFITEPVIPKKAEPITPIALEDPLSENELDEENKKLQEYICNAMTAETVNKFADSMLENSGYASAAVMAKDHPEEFSKIIGLHTYSCTDEARFRFDSSENVVVENGYRFNDFTIRKKV